MKLLNFVVCACLVAYAASEGETGSGADPSETTFEDKSSPSSVEYITNSDSSDSPFTVVFSTDASTTQDEETSPHKDMDTDNDTIILFSTTRRYENATDELVSTTVYDDGFTATGTVTTVDEEDVSGNNKSACFSNPCKNGGTCLDDISVPYFGCVCAAGHVGLRCETTDGCTTDEDGQLCRKGFCSYSQDGQERFCDCFLGDYWDNVTAECRVVKTVCDSNPCENGGVCNILSGNKYNCSCELGFSGKTCEVTDLCATDDDCGHGICDLSADKKSRSCKCDDGFYVQEQPHTCKAVTTPCDLQPCENGGVCNFFGDKTYNCTCESGFSGKACEVRDWCVADENCGHGVCVLSEDKKSRSCKCSAGFYLEKQSHTCKKISNACQPNPCLHDGICTVLSTNQYNCTCSDGFTGKTCEIRDMCIMDGGNAYCDKGTCENNYDLGIYYCICLDKEYFQYADRKCVKLDLCPLIRCESNEKCSLGACDCMDNYKRNNDTGKCEPDFCSEQPCPIPDMLCREGTGATDYKCSCQKGYTFNGTHCNEALCIFPQLNPCEQNCSTTENGYECSCDEEFHLKDDNKTCDLTGNNTCVIKACEKGSCVLKSDEEICICPPGYTEVDGNCTDICSAGEIAPGICPDDECEVTAAGGFRCKCEGKFAYSEDKTTCVVRNMCQENEIGWKKCKERNAECLQNWNVTEGFQCQCSSGKVEIEDGSCRDVCDIESNQRECSMKWATCDVDRTGNMVCQCPPYFKANEKNGKCNKAADVSYLITLPLDRSTYTVGNRMKRSLDPSVDYDKISRDVKMTIEDMFYGFRRSSVLYCNTTSGYFLCKIEVQFAMEYETQLQRLGTEDICLSEGHAKKCLLPPSLVLIKERISQDVVIESTNPCEKYIKEELCGSETSCTSSLRDKSFNCSCKPGFQMRNKNYPFDNEKSVLESCSDIDECLEGPCPPNSFCLNTLGSYTCSCMKGFRNVEEERTTSPDELKCLEICRPNPCTHGLCSRRGDHDFDCNCEAGFKGAFCDLQDENFKRARVNTIVVGVVLGGILLITFILFAVCVSRLRRRKCLENPGGMFYNSTEMTERGRINNAFQRE